jgi:hypothetical protein
VVIAFSVVAGATLIVVVGRRLLVSASGPPAPSRQVARGGNTEFGRHVSSYLEDVEAAGSADIER